MTFTCQAYLHLGYFRYVVFQNKSAVQKILVEDHNLQWLILYFIYLSLRVCFITAEFLLAIICFHRILSVLSFYHSIVLSTFKIPTWGVSIFSFLASICYLYWTIATSAPKIIWLSCQLKDVDQIQIRVDDWNKNTCLLWCFSLVIFFPFWLYIHV